MVTYKFISEKMLLVPIKEYNEDFIKEVNNKLPDENNYIETLNYLNKFKNRNFTAKKSLPSIGGIALTNNCQLACSYCINSSVPCDDSITNLNSVKEFVKYLCINYKAKAMISKDKIDERGVVLHLTGGGETTSKWEAFCNTVDTVKNVFSKNNVPYTLFMTTNGILNNKQIEYICKNIDSVMISYDGTKNLQNTNRPLYNKCPTHDIVFNTIAQFDKHKHVYSIRSTLWHDQLHNIKEIADNLYGNFKNFQEWTINPVNSVGRANDYTVNNNVDPEDFLKYFLEVKEYIKLKYEKDNFNILFLQNSMCDIMCGIMSVEAPWLYPDDKIKICVDGANLSPEVGKIEKGKLILYDNFENNLFDEYYRRFTSTHCRNCLAYRFCAGGCPAKFLRDHKESAEWECETVRAYWKYIFEQVAKGKNIFGWKAIPIEESPFKEKGILKFVRDI